MHVHEAYRQTHTLDWRTRNLVLLGDTFFLFLLTGFFFLRFFKTTQHIISIGKAPSRCTCVIGTMTGAYLSSSGYSGRKTSWKSLPILHPSSPLSLQFFSWWRSLPRLISILDFQFRKCPRFLDPTLYCVGFSEFFHNKCLQIQGMGRKFFTRRSKPSPFRLCLLVAFT